MSQPQFDLPDGWYATLDRRTGRFYFWNLFTKERTWTPPVRDGPSPHELLGGAVTGLGSDVALSSPQHHHQQQHQEPAHQLHQQQQQQQQAFQQQQQQQQHLQHLQQHLHAQNGNVAAQVAIPDQRQARRNGSRSISSESSTSGLSSPMSNSCNITGGDPNGAHDADQAVRQIGASQPITAQMPPFHGGPLGSLTSAARPPQPYFSRMSDLTGLQSHSRRAAANPGGGDATGEDGTDSDGLATNKRQRAATETMGDAPGYNEEETGHLMPLGATNGMHQNPDGTFTGIPPGNAKRFIKGVMSIIGKKTSFSRDKKRRENVIAERSMSVEPSSERAAAAAFFPKSPETRELLLSILRGQYIFSGLSNDEHLQVVDMMSKEEVCDGQVLIQQGDRGDFFYIVEDGLFDVLVAGGEGDGDGDDAPKKVGQIPSGGSFGELALLYGQKRAATVKAVTNSIVWKLDRAGFRSMLRSSARHDIQEAFAALRAVPLLSVLRDEQIEKCAHVVRFCEFKRGEQIIRKGEIGDVFYIIKRGQVEVSGGVSLKGGEDSPPVTLGPHAFFGERALLTDEARAANVVALTEVMCLVLDRYAFTTILGPLRQVLDDNIRVSVLKQIELFSSLEQSDVDRIFEAFTIETFEPNEYIIQQGELASKFYVLRVGEATVTQRVKFPNNGPDVTNVVGKLNSGDYFGEMALMESGVREASVIATTRCQCNVLDRSVFEGLLSPAAILHRDIKKRRQENAKLHKALERQRNYEEQQQRLIQEQQAVAMEVDPAAPLRRTNHALADLVKVKTLGTGTFGRVQLVRHRNTGQTYALKVQSKAQITKHKLQQNIVNEKLILATLNHPFVITLHQTFQSRDCLYMLLELVQGGELFSFLQNYGASLQSMHHVFYVANVVSAFAFLHSKSILYRDLKPENILIDTDGYLKLVDFGFAKIERHRTYTLCGTPEYFSPELVLGRGYGAGNDVWGIGILCFEVICGYTPFGGPDDNSNEVCKRIVKNHLVFPDDCEDDEARRLIASLLRKDPLKRLGCGLKGMLEVMAHPWFKLVNWDDLQCKRIKAPWIPQVTDPADGSLFDDYDEEFEVAPYLETGPSADWTLHF